METPKPTEWFVEYQGSQSGPYSLEQLKQMSQNGALTLEHKVTTPTLEGQWFSVKELMAAGGFQPPPKPTFLNQPFQKPLGSTPQTNLQSDPQAELLETLLKAREKSKIKPAFDPSPQKSSESNPGPDGAWLHLISRNRYPAIGSAAVLILLSVFLWPGTKKEPTSATQEGPKTAPVAKPLPVGPSIRQTPSPISKNPPTNRFVSPFRKVEQPAPEPPADVNPRPQKKPSRNTPNRPSTTNPPTEPPPNQDPVDNSDDFQGEPLPDVPDYPNPNPDPDNQDPTKNNPNQDNPQFNQQFNQPPPPPQPDGEGANMMPDL